MRKELHVHEQDIHAVLTLLGYCMSRKDGSHWRRQWFHLIIRKKKHKLILYLHEDLPSYYPPFHKACYTGKAVSQEMHKILEACKRRRAAKK